MSDPLHLFEGIGVEIEYMIVDADSLDVRPIADRLLEAVGGTGEVEVDLGSTAWSNELALHVIELKTNGPCPSLSGLGARFHEDVGRMHDILDPLGARLMPGGMHPWMDPHRELRLWPHENDVIYAAFDRIFDCRGHGWANLQATHINLPFAGDDEFARLHAAIRLVLPLLPGLAASSPVVEGAVTNLCDTRLEVYRTNAERVPSVSGRIIPERAFSHDDYQTRVLEPIYRDMAPLDPEGVLRHEWINARGAIARFDRMAIEIRLLDTQECPQADVAVAAAVTGAVRALVDQRWVETATQRAWAEDDLLALLLDGIRGGDEAVIRNQRYLECLGFPEPGSGQVREVWQHLIESCVDAGEECSGFLAAYLEHGCLARRLRRAVGAASASRIADVYRRLCDCLREGRVFRPDDV